MTEKPATIIRRLFTALLALLIAAPIVSLAQRTYSQAELDQMLAPIALYPDPLLSQVLMAATYPAELSEAASWSRANPALQGDDAVRAVQYEDWDPSVKSLAAFPQILARMDENPGWTRSLGDAFLRQEPHVMETVQRLRQRARAAGQLASDERLRVVEQSNSIVIQPVNPQFVYLPYYDPRVIYGPWWWPAYQPVYWAPWPGYARPYQPGFSVGFWWSTPVVLSVNFFFGNFDWHHRQARVVQPSVYYYRPPVVVNQTVVVTPHRWRHEPRHREALAERRVARQPIRVQAQPATRVPAQPQMQAQPGAQSVVRPQRQARPQAEAQPQPLLRQEQRPRIPEARAPQQPRTERVEHPQERRELRQEQRSERARKGSDRS